MGGLKLVHCADLHLDSPFVGVEGEDPDLHEQLYEATFAAFSRIVDLCLSERADALTIGGDVYDRETRSLRAQLRFREEVARLAERGIPVFVVHGNHDPLSGWSAALEWPDGVHIFGPEVEEVPLVRDGKEVARVCGVSYDRPDVRDNLAKQFPARRVDGWRIGLLHANVGGDPRHGAYAPCSADDLAEAGIDLWLLGHVHTARCWEHRGVWMLYPGTPQGRHRRERGAKGCYVVTLDEGGVKASFRPVDVLRWEEVEVPVDGLTREEELFAALDERLGEVLREAGRPVIADVRLVGRGPLARVLRREGFLEEWRDEWRRRWYGDGRGVWINRLEASVGAVRSAETWIREPTFLGELLRYVGERREAGTWLEEAGEALAALRQLPEMRRLVEEPGWEDLEAWTDRALDRLLDALMPPEEEG
ncbi:MAG: DNA repair exonuclease [Alicyclobacillaceae bacterium]|nr:DNA repair exonuclease [Alicyclobacillaceae bacterium]